MNHPLLSWTHDTLFEFWYLSTFPELRTVLAAERGTLDRTGKVLTIKVKKGLTFSNGEPLTAKNFIASWETLSQLGTESVAHRTFLSRIQSLSTRDDDTLVITLKKPDPDFEMLLTLPFTAPIALDGKILPSSPSATNFFSAVQTPPTSSGPFILSEWHPGFGLILRARNGYSNSFFPTNTSKDFRDLGYLERSSKPLPQINGIRVDWTDTSADAWKLFRDGKSDILEVHPDFAAEILEPGKPWMLQTRWRARGMKLEKGWRPALTLIMVNLKTIPSAQERRQILSHLDISYWQSIPKFVEQSLPHMKLKSLPQLDGWIDLGTRAPIKADSGSQQKLPKKKSGLTKRVIRLEIVGQDEQAMKMLEVAQNRLERGGFGVNSSNHDLSTAVENFRKGESDLLILGWRWEFPSWRNTLEPIFWLQPAEVQRSTDLQQLEATLLNSHLKPAQKAEKIDQQLEKLAVWSPGPRHHRELVVQPWIFGFHVSSSVESPEKYLWIDRDLRKNYIGN